MKKLQMAKQTTMTEDEKKKLLAERMAQKKAELAAAKKSKIDDLKKQIMDAKKKGDLEEMKRLLAEIKAVSS